MAGLEIAVAGCGPGGLAAALQLHRLGHRVTMFERFDTPRPVGSGLLIQPAGLDVLDALGLGERIRREGAAIARLSGISVESGKRALDVDYAALGPGRTAWGVHRSLLFSTIHDAVRSEGIAIETRREIAESEPASANRRRLVFADGRRSAPFDLIVDALGARSTLAPHCGTDLPYGAFWATLAWPEGAGFADDALDQRYRHASEMAGVMPIGERSERGQGAAFFWSLRADRVEAFHARGTAAWRDDVLALWTETGPLLDQIADTRDLVFARYAHRTLTSPVSPGLVHIGDAWHSTSPQLGQGANMALLDAAALAQALAYHRSLHDALAHYRWLRSGHVRLYQAMSRIFTPLYQSGDRLRPWLRDQAVHRFAARRPARKLVAKIVSGGLGLSQASGTGEAGASQPR